MQIALVFMRAQILQCFIFICHCVRYYTGSVPVLFSYRMNTFCMGTCKPILPSRVIGHKETHRLAQMSGSYQVLIYRKKVFRKKDSDNILSPATPVNVLEGTYADVSLLAGLMVDKAVYHLPLHRHHLRMLHIAK
jgi:hypothetical protein